MDRTLYRPVDNIPLAMIDKGEQNVYNLLNRRKSATSLPKSPGVSRRKWSPHQAALCKRKKIDGDQETLNDSFDHLDLTDLRGDDPDEEDYLTKSLNSIEKSSPVGSRRKYTARGASNPMTFVSNKQSASTKSKKVTRPLPPIAPKSWERQPSNRKISIASTDTKIRGTSSTTSMKTNRPCTSRNSISSKSSLRTKPNPVLKEKKPLIIPIEMQHKLCRITDPNISIKEKVELELAIMKGSPEEKRLYLQYKSQFDRQKFLEWRAADEQEKNEKIKAEVLVQEKIEIDFLKSVELKRKKERKRERQQRARERKVLDAARRYKAETVVETMAEIQKAAKAATISAERNQKEKKALEEAERERIENFRRNEGKDMYDAQRALKEALIQQKDPKEKRKQKEEKKKRRSYMMLKASSQGRSSAVF